MFDNPEKLLILLVIALLIFGPSKLAGLGGTIGKTIREFRSAVRGAQETFTSEMHQAAAEVDPSQHALPAPDGSLSPVPGASTGAPGWHDGAPAGSTVTGVPAEGGTASVGSHEPPGAESVAPSDLDQSSLASEPTAEALRKSLTGHG